MWLAGYYYPSLISFLESGGSGSCVLHLKSSRCYVSASPLLPSPPPRSLERVRHYGRHEVCRVPVAHDKAHFSHIKVFVVCNTRQRPHGKQASAKVVFAVCLSDPRQNKNTRNKKKATGPPLLPCSGRRCQLRTSAAAPLDLGRRTPGRRRAASSGRRPLPPPPLDRRRCAGGGIGARCGSRRTREGARGRAGEGA